MLRINYTNGDIDELSKELYYEFKTMENILLNALKIVEEYEEQIESFKINQ